jgi:hypothetical protein
MFVSTTEKVFFGKEREKASEEKPVEKPSGEKPNEQPPGVEKTSRPHSRDPVASGVKCGPHGGMNSNMKSWTVSW